MGRYRRRVSVCVTVSRDVKELVASGCRSWTVGRLLKRFFETVARLVAAGYSAEDVVEIFVSVAEALMRSRGVDSAAVVYSLLRDGFVQLSLAHCVHFAERGVGVCIPFGSSGFLVDHGVFEELTKILAGEFVSEESRAWRLLTRLEEAGLIIVGPTGRRYLATEPITSSSTA